VTALPRQSRGFSLTELLVAMVVGLFLLGGLVTLMVNSKKNYEQQDYNARLQENARFAMEFLSYDLRMAGYYGCSNNIINDNTVVPATATEGGSGGTPDSVTITYGQAYDAGDEVFIDPDAASNDAYGSPLTWELNRLPAEWSTGDEVVVADCGSASVVTITNINSSSDQITVDGPLGRVYDSKGGTGGAITVRRLVTNTYAIQSTGQSGIPVLTRDNGSGAQELVEGVENIQLLYQGLGGGAFVDGASAPTQLAGVQLGALVRSVSNVNLDDREYGSGTDITTDSGAYTVLGQDVSGVTPQIRGQRRTFSSTLAVRNRPL